MIPGSLNALLASPDLLSVLTLAAGLGLFALGMFVLIREQGSQISVVFFVLTLAMAVWMIGFSRMYVAAGDNDARWWARFGFMGVVLIPSAVFHFSALIMQEYDRVRKIVLAAWMTGICFAVLALTTNMQFHSLHRYPWGWYPRSGLPAVPFIAFFFVLSSAALFSFWTQYRAAERGTVRSLRARSLLVLTAVGLGSSIDFLSTFGIPLYPIGYLPVFIFIVLSFRSTVRYRFMAITPSFASRLIIDTMHDALIVLDPDGVVNVVNQAAVNLLARPEKDLVNRRLSAGMVHDAAFAEKFETAIRSGPVRNLELTYRPQDGPVRTFTLSTSIMKNRFAEQVATVCVVSDITDRKRAETERESLIAQLQDAMSHVKLLSGLLPICSSCKKIRDDKGYWNQIETYLWEHSEAKFTHGICPDCAGKLLEELNKPDTDRHT